MNYYPFHIGDYAAHTAHLSPIEDIAYRRCIDLYYLHESALPMDLAEVARLIRMREHADVVAAVVREFFAQGVDGWYHDRCSEEIERMQDKQEKARASAQASVNARRANAQRPLNGRSTNAQQDEQTDVELPTPTPTPTPNKKTKGAIAPEFVLPDWISAEAWAGYIDMRKRIKKPMTKRAMELAVGKLAELMRSGHDAKTVLDQSTMNSWQGLFEIKGGATASRSNEPAWREEQRSRVAQAVPSIAARPIQQPRTIEMEATHVAPPALGR
jgi:uncharacterized protein YdaU (DUF1376 family)